jgi:acyl transferase domain-containing protein/3-hydroxymyristoyl/3-hydroxydecanoyl-(acyl carrier protein) dehydratase
MEKIAIVGLSCLFPGAKTPEEFWQILQSETDVSSLLSEIELGVSPDLYFHPKKGQIDKINYNKNGYIRGFESDLSGYNVSESKLKKLDKLFHWTLYSADQALKDAGYAKGGKEIPQCGMILGNVNMPTHATKHLASQYYNDSISPLISELIGNDFKIAPYWQDKDWSNDNMLIGSHNVVIAAQALGLTGPSFSLDAACSSAIYAIELARQYLLTGQSYMMLAGATCHVDHIVINHGFNILQAYPDANSGQSTPLSYGSKGLKGGEGAGIVVLKRLSDAQKDGDKVYAVIETIGLSNDAGAKHMLVPSTEGQQLAMQRAYADKKLHIDYLECHATGTEAGDSVELDSIAHFFSKQTELPKIGANKSNFGHMLTAASMASIFKVILAMRYSKIPATIGVTEFICSHDKKLNEKHLVSKLTEWPINNQNSHKYGAINAFGFGGVNGHLCLSTATHEDQSRNHTQSKNDTTKLSTESLAIVGMSVNIPGQSGLRKFDSMTRKGEKLFSELPEKRWSGVEKNKALLAKFGLEKAPCGVYANYFYFDCLRYKIPPNVAGLHLLSHLSMLPMAERAFVDAGYQLDGKPKNIAVIISGDSDLNSLRYQARLEMAWQVRDSLKNQQLNLSDEEISELETIVKDAIFPAPHVEGITGGISNMVASRISAHLKLNGPSFSLQSHENSALVALQVAQILIRGGHIDAAIIGSGSFSGSAENVLFSPRIDSLNSNQSGIPFLESPGWNIGEGGGVVVIKSDKNTTEQDRVYAKIKALEIIKSPAKSNSNQPDSEAIYRAAHQALSHASLTPSQIDYLEVYASGIHAEDAAEEIGLTKAYQSTPTTIGSVKTNVGHMSGASAIVSLIKTALCLYSRYLPPCPGVHSEKSSSNGNFELLDSLEHKSEMKYAAINSFGLDQNYAHLVLEAAGCVNDEPLDTRTLSWEKEYQEGLLKKIWVSGEKTYQNHILDEKNREKFSQVRTKLAKQSDQNIVIQQSLYDSTIKSSKKPLARQTDHNEKTPHENRFIRNLAIHQSYLATQKTMLSRLHQIIQKSDSALGNKKQLLKSQLSEALRPAPEPIPFKISPRSKHAVFNEAQLKEMTDGKVGNILGEKYAQADKYLIRTRMPSLPFNFVSRITKLTAKYGVLKPCTIEWEYDIPQDAWYVTGLVAPSFVSLESSHAMIVAYTIIGCDEMFKGELNYRAVNCSTTIHSHFPGPGETLRGKVDITSFKRMGSSILVNYTYFCHVGNRLCFELNASSGFFSRAEISKSKSMNTKSVFLLAKKQENPKLLNFVTNKTSFTTEEIVAFGKGLFSQCFGPLYQNIPFPTFKPATQMLDRIPKIQTDGGAWGLGYALGEVDISPDHWAFKAHFKNDPCLPGTLIIEGCEQMLKFYMAYLGFSSLTHLRQQWHSNLTSTAKFRGEVKCKPATLTYRFTVKAMDIKIKDEIVQSIFLNSTIETLYEDKVIGLCDDMSAIYGMEK